MAAAADNRYHEGERVLLTNRVFLAEEALSFGLANAVLPLDESIPYLIKFTREMVATVSPGSLCETEGQIYNDLHRDVAGAVESSWSLIEIMVKHPDFA
jgi:enoyl-CoA hydratase/carnithine racemase